MVAYNDLQSATTKIVEQTTTRDIAKMAMTLLLLASFGGNVTFFTVVISRNKKNNI